MNSCGRSSIRGVGWAIVSSFFFSVGSDANTRFFATQDQAREDDPKW